MHQCAGVTRLLPANTLPTVYEQIECYPGSAQIWQSSTLDIGSVCGLLFSEISTELIQHFFNNAGRCCNVNVNVM